MRYEDFIGRVQEYAELDTPEQALQLTQAVLGTLGERMYRTEREDLAAQLPKELKDFLFVVRPPEPTRRDVQRFSLEELHNRVIARAEVNRSTADQQARAVVRVLQQAVSPGEIEDVRAVLPVEFDDLFQ